MSAASPPVDRSRLDARIHAEYDYTNDDAVIDTLNEIVTCPIVQEVTCPMLIFNNQCYETNAFDQFLLSENARKNYTCRVDTVAIELNSEIRKLVKSLISTLSFLR